MELTNVIMGPVVTEKAERLKAGMRTYVLQVHPDSTKISITQALEKFYEVSVQQVRIMWTQPKTRALATGTMEKRHRSKRALVTLTKDSKALDITAFRSHS